MERKAAAKPKQNNSKQSNEDFVTWHAQGKEEQEMTHNKSKMRD